MKRRHKARFLKYDGKNCRKCNGHISLDADSFSLESYTKEVFCFNCGDRWWVPYHSLEKASEYQGAREPDEPPLFEAWQVAQKIVDAVKAKSKIGRPGVAKGSYKHYKL